MYCKKCGGKLESYASNCAFCGTPVEKYDTKVNYVKPEKQERAKPKHMNTWKWIGLAILPGIPVLGALIYLILMFKWAFGKTQDLTLKGYAKANLLMLLVALLLIGAAVVLIVTDKELLLELEKTFKELKQNLK